MNLPAPAADLPEVSAGTAALIGASKSPNTLRAYRAALGGFDASGRPATDEGVAAHVADLAAAGRSVATARTLVAALMFRAAPNP